MNTREQLLKALADCREGQEEVVILKIVEPRFKDQLRKKNNEAKNLRVRMLDAEKANKIIIEKYQNLVSYLGLKQDAEDLRKAQEAVRKTEEENIAANQSPKEYRKRYVELKESILLYRLREAKEAYITALLDVVVSTMKDHEEDGSLFLADDKESPIVVKDNIDAWLQRLYDL